MCIEQCISDQYLIGIMHHQQLFFKNNTSHPVCNGRGWLKFKVYDVLMPTRIVYSILILMYPQIKSLVVLNNGFIQCR